MLVLFVMFAVVVISLLLGELGQEFATMGMTLLPIGLLAVLAHVGEHKVWARGGTLALLALLVLAAAAVFAQQASDLLEIRGQVAADATSATGDASGSSENVAGDDQIILGIWTVSLLGVVLSALMLVRAVRVRVAQVLPIDERRFAHAVALSLTVAFVASSCAPLLCVGEPVTTALVVEEARAQEGGATGSPADLYFQVYQLLWLLPVCFLGVGYGVHRSFAQSLARLGLVRPTGKQLLGSVGVAMALVIGVGFLSLAIDSAWEFLGWRGTDKEGVEQLMGYMLTPVGALVVGVSAGLGEELLVRGVLQPRLGIALSNLLFTALHAGQYGFDLLLVIFAVGSVFGLVRKYTNTTVSAVVHGLYDVFLISIAMANG